MPRPALNTVVIQEKHAAGRRHSWWVGTTTRQRAATCAGPVLDFSARRPQRCCKRAGRLTDRDPRARRLCHRIFRPYPVHRRPRRGGACDGDELVMPGLRNRWLARSSIPTAFATLALAASRGLPWWSISAIAPDRLPEDRPPRSGRRTCGQGRHPGHVQAVGIGRRLRPRAKKRWLRKGWCSRSGRSRCGPGRPMMPRSPRRHACARPCPAILCLPMCASVLFSGAALCARWLGDATAPRWSNTPCSAGGPSPPMTSGPTTWRATLAPGADGHPGRDNRFPAQDKLHAGPRSHRPIAC